MTTAHRSQRFFYLVRHSAGKWEVSFGEDGTRFLYDSLSEAMQIARGAARLHWETRHEPSGVVFESRGPGSVECEFGP